MRERGWLLLGACALAVLLLCLALVADPVLGIGAGCGMAVLIAHARACTDEERRR